MGNLGIQVRSEFNNTVLQQIIKRFSGQDVLDDIAAIILRRNRERFLRGVDPNNNRWPQSESARRRRAGLPDSQGIRRVGSSGNTLFSTGSLFEAIQVIRARSTSTERVVTVNPAFTNRKSGVRVLSYAIKHQLGQDGLPRREFLGVNTEDRQVVDTFIQRLLDNI